MAALSCSRKRADCLLGGCGIPAGCGLARHPRLVGGRRSVRSPDTLARPAIRQPLFMLHTLRRSPLPLVYVDVDLEFRVYPELFAPTAWPTPCDVMLFNWQARVSWLAMVVCGWLHRPDITWEGLCSALTGALLAGRRMCRLEAGEGVGSRRPQASSS